MILRQTIPKTLLLLPTILFPLVPSAPHCFSAEDDTLQPQHAISVRTEEHWGSTAHLLRGGLVVAQNTRGNYELIVELQNRCSHPAEYEFDPEDLEVKVFDAEGNLVKEPNFGVRSGPVPQPLRGIIAPGTYVGLTTHRGGVPFGKNDVLFAAGWQAWYLSPGKYTVSGTVKVTLSHGEEALEPFLPSRSTPKWDPKAQEIIPLKEKKQVALELGKTTFEITDSNSVKNAKNWSKPVNGLLAKLELIEDSEEFGVRWLVPYLVLQNVRDLASPLEVACDSNHLKVELVDKDGNTIESGQSLPRSGPHADPGTVVLPIDSNIRFSLECRNWGIPRDSPAMISTDSGAWVISNEQKGKVFLRATLVGEKADPYWKQWHGEIQTPLIAVNWE